ncbi:lipid II flippase FtsW [bacterium BMS3Bbin08]|nr:lipid II flippase FtsW [bacterium BMS3Bbin08]
MNPANNVRGIIIPVLALTGIGILMVYSSSVFISTEKFGSSFHYLWRHLFTVFIGLSAMVVLAKVDYHKLRFLVIPLMLLSVVMLVLVFVPGIGVSAGPHSEVRRWIRLWPSTFQPSEFVKITMVLFLADYISRNIHKMRDLRCGVVIPIAVMVVFQGIILLQPDFGAVMSIGIITMTLLFIGGIKWRFIMGIIILSLPVVYKLILSAPYRMKRIMAFLDPWQDAQGGGFQLVQSFLAFGRGGLTGVGIGHSKQKLFFLPEAHTDFIFSLIGEELGLIGVLAVISLFIWLFIRGFKTAMRTEDSFGYYLALGLTLMIVSQTLVNFSVATGLMPTKGLPLPFISYGGSAFLVNMAAVGILINISKNPWNQTTGRAAWGMNTALPDEHTDRGTCLDYFTLPARKPGIKREAAVQNKKGNSWRIKDR